MMKKKLFFVMLMVAVLVLSGCSSLVKRDSAVDARQTIVSVNGETVSKQSFLSVYNYNLYNEQYYAQMMAQFGVGDGSVDTAAIQQNTLQNYIKMLITNQKAAELGLDQFTEEEKAALDEQAQQRYQEQLDAIKETSFADQEPTQEELESAARDQGYTLESLRSTVENETVNQRLEEYTTRDVQVDDAALQKALEEKIADQQDRFAASGNALNTAVNADETLYSVPEGYRVIRAYRMDKPDADENGEANLDEFNQKTADMHDRVAAGQPMDGLDVTETEYRINETSTLPSADLTAAAMALTEKGAVTDVIETNTAAFVIAYVEDVEAHTATLEEVRDSLYAEVLDSARTDAYNAAVDAWTEEADIQTFLDRLN